ncbi:unnamed protein product [Symbiodinium sp. CCMP2592]|nr:unnamed protein product [Symbiodinium sp. CCMP2592]
MIDGAREPFYQLSTITVEAAEITIKELPIHATSTTSAITVASMSSPLDMPLRSMLAEADIEGKRKGQDDGGDGLAASIFEEDDTGADTGMPVDMETPCAKRSAASLFENSDSDAHDDADAQIGDGECELEIEGQEIMHGIEERREGKGQGRGTGKGNSNPATARWARWGRAKQLGPAAPPLSESAGATQIGSALAGQLSNVTKVGAELVRAGLVSASQCIAGLQRAVNVGPLAQLLGESRFCVHEGSDPQCSGSIPTQGQDLDQVNESYSLVGDPSADSQATRPGVRECELPASARTPVHLPVSSKEVEVYPCKLFLTQQRFSMLLTRKGAGQPAAKAQATEIIEDPSESTSKSSKFKTENAQEAPNTLQIEAHLTSPLQVLHTNSAANIASALQKNMHSEVVDQARSFDRVLHVVTTDDYAANHLAEKMLTQQEMCELHGDVSEDDPARSDDKAGKLHLICEVHRLHGVAASMYSLCPDFISGLIKASLVLRSGHMSSLRRCLRALIVAKLRVYQCEPPENVVAGPSIPASKAFFMNTFFSNLASADALLLQELFNGDWGETMQRFLREGVRLLAGAAPSIFPRHKWIGSDAAIDWYGRLQCVHGLLTQVFEDVFGPSPGPSRPNKPTASDPAQSQSSHAQAQSRAQTRPSDAMDTDDVEAQAQDDRGQLLALQVFETCGFAAADSGDRQDDQWKAIAKKWRDAAYAWACGHPDGPLALLAEMVFLRTVLGPQVNLMAKQLKLSSSEFDQQQALAELTTGLRKYRLTEVHADSASAEAEVALAKLFQKSHWESLPFVFLTQRNNSFAFKLTARVLAALKVYIRNRRSGYPYKLFLLATAQATEAERVAKEIVFDFFYEPCRLDSFTWWFVKGFRSAERLASAEARAHLQAIAKVASVDIAATECQHASNRRHIESKSIQSHRQLLAAASAAYVARTLRHTCAPSRGFQSSKPVPRKPGRKPRTKPDFRSVHFPRAQDLRRGGGSWNVFLSQNRGGPQVTTPAGKHSKAQLRKRYHDLKRQAGSDWQELQRLGSLKTQARKFAKKGSGPLIPRKRKATDALPPVAEHGSLLNTKHLRLQQRRLAVKQDREKQQAVRDSACRLQDSLSHADVSASEQAVLNFSGITAQELCRDADSSRPVSSCPPQLELIEPGSVAALPVSVNQSAPAKLESISTAASMDAMAMESMEAAARAAAETTMTMAMNPASVWALRPDVANSRTGLCLDTSATAMHAAPFFLAQISQGEPSFLRGMTNFQNLDLAWHQRHEVVSTASGVAEGEKPDQPARACAEVLPSIKDDQHEQQEEDVDPQSQDRVPAAKRTKTLKVSKSKLRNTMRGILSVHAVSKDVLKDGCLFLRFSSCSPEQSRQSLRAGPTCYDRYQMPVPLYLKLILALSWFKCIATCLQHASGGAPNWSMLLEGAKAGVGEVVLVVQAQVQVVALQQSMLEQEERQGNSESEGSDDTAGKFAEFFASRARRRANAAGEDEVAAESVGSQDSDEHWGQEDADERIGASLLAEDPNLQPGTLDLPFGHSVETTAAATAMAMAARASGAEPSGSATVRDAAAESFAEALMSAMAFEDEFEAELRGGGAIGAMSESGDENRNVPTPPAPLSVHPPATPPVRDPSDELGRGHDRPASDSAVPSAPSRAPPVRGSSARTAALPAGPRLVHDGLAIRNDDGSILAWIKHKPQSNDFFVNCSLHENCTKTKTLRSSQRHGRRLQGRPLGFLAAWAVQGHACLSKEAHSLVVPSFLDRKNARARLRQEANASEFFVKERDRRSDEPDSEPDHCP